MDSNKKTARLAGLIYLLIVLSGIFSLMYFPSQLFDWDNATKTVSNIREHLTLFKFGAIGALFCYVLFLVLPLVLYFLLRKVHEFSALLMVIFAIASVPISMTATLHLFDVIDLLHDTHYAVFSSDELTAQVMLSLDSYYNGIHISEIFWGLWLFPFGYLVFKSGFLPKFFGVFLMLGCVGYLVSFFGSTFFDGYYDTLFSTLAGIPSSIGEIGICLWLLIMGIKEVK